MVENNKKINILKILGIALGILYFVLLLVHDAYESRYFEVMEAILPNASIRIIMTILRAFTSGSVMIAIFSSVVMRLNASSTLSSTDLFGSLYIWA